MTTSSRRALAYGTLPLRPTTIKKTAVLIDGSALFLASRAPEERRLNYLALRDLLVREVEGLKDPSAANDSIWTMWTAADPSNLGQAKFLEFAEQRLSWHVRRTLPWQAFMIEPDALFGISGSDAVKASRLMRFDAQIAFAMGRLAETHRLVVITDSYALCDPIMRINENWGAEHGRCVLSFFGHACDPRWRAALKTPYAPKFIDFDDYEPELFGIERKEVKLPEARPGQLVF